MQITTRLELEAKILKHVRQRITMISKGYTITSPIDAQGFFFKDLMHKMWYFIRKNNITEQDVFKVMQRLQTQGLLKITMLNGRVYVTPPAPHLGEHTEEEIEELARDIRVTKVKLTPDQIVMGQAIARKYQRERERERAMGIDALGNKTEDSTSEAMATEATTTNQEISIEDDQATLEDYLKDE